MLTPSLRAAAHAVWPAGLVRPYPSDLAARCRYYTLISTEPGAMAAHSDARHQLSGKFTPPIRPRHPDDRRVLGNW